MTLGSYLENGFAGTPHQDPAAGETKNSTFLHHGVNLLSKNNYYKN
jgi:hypothetical protein